MLNKKSLIILGLGVVLGITSCMANEEPNVPPIPSVPEKFKVSLKQFQDILMNEANTFEVEESISSTSVNTTDKDHKTDVLEEKGVFLKENVSFYEGHNKTTFKNDKTTREDKYTKVAQAKTYDMQKVFYLVTDYEKEEFEIYKDSANRLPVVQDGDPKEDGINYLLESSLPNQLCKQVSLNVAVFISGNLTNNPSLNGYALPDVNVEKKGENYEYTFEPFGYSYDQEGTEVHVSSEFCAVLTEDFRLLEAKTIYETIETSGEDSYTVTDTNEYKLEYGTRKSLSEFTSSGGKTINPEDYFLYEVKTVNPYYYDNGTKISVEPNKLPVGKYVRFDAKDYLPAKSVDTDMKVVSIVTNPDNAFEVEGGALYIKGMGKSKIKLESQTGIAFEIDVETIKPQIAKLTLIDMYAGFDKVDDKTVKAFEDETYKNIRLSVDPEGADLNDIKVEISHPELLDIKVVESKDATKYINYEFTFKPNSAGNDITVTFSSISNPQIKVSKTYRVVKKMTLQDIKNKMIANSYKWTNIYGHYDFVLTFQDETHGTYTVYDPDGKATSVCKFTYELGTDLKISMTPVEGQFSYVYDYKDSFVSKDAEYISLSDPEFTRDQVFTREVK